MKQLIELNQKEIDNISGGLGVRGVTGGVVGMGVTFAYLGMSAPIALVLLAAFACARVAEGHGPLGKSLESLFSQDKQYKQEL